MTQETYFNDTLSHLDPEVFGHIQDELKRQSEVIELIASENLVSPAVMQAQGSVFTNKYAEGLPGKRYYGGCQHVDEVETLAIERAKKLFGCGFANVQPNSGSQANQAVYLALLKPGAKLLSMSLDHGGHLTHGSPVNISGKWFDIVPYGVNEQGVIDYDQVEKLALEHKPDMLVCGASAYSRIVDWKRFREIADKVNAYLLADVAHYAGLIAAGAIPNPCDHAHVVTTTTHKTLRGPRGGMILSNDETLFKKLNSAVFPGLQGGPLEHVIAGKAVAFGQALKPEFKTYARQIIANTKQLAETLKERGYKIVSDGTDTHVFLVDLRGRKFNGKQAQYALERAHLNCNRNTVPNDPESPMITSGLRLGAAAGTTRGFKEAEYTKIGNWIADILDGLADTLGEANETLETKTANEIKAFLKDYPIYSKAIA
ncbi:MAG: serine hydroxymethyltransferase [Micavibrio sp.]|nr:serine hydroxymethyltransferase [Micavibrio sp.]